MPERKSRRTSAPAPGGGRVHRRGDGLGTGPVGTGDRTGGTHAPGQGRANGYDRSESGYGTSRGFSFGSGGFNLKTIITVLIIIAVLGSGSGLFSCFIGGSSENGIGSMISGIGSFSGIVSSVSNAWLGEDNTGVLNRQVDASARDKYTTVFGGGKDVNTIMVYMCGTDLESKYGMATKDLREMAKASIGTGVHLIVYTGGCKSWQTRGISNTNNMILEIRDGKIGVLKENDGNKKMVSPDTLSGFIQYCKKNFPANRYDLILWDHGGGSVTGFGYDEKNPSSGSMSLSGIAKALRDGGVQFDFVGFDACLMATAETAIMLEPYADYMIASEESEPGVGWYYTDWLTKLGQNPSMDTLEIGRNICDDFVSSCRETCRGQSTTLSLIDVAEFSSTVPEKLKAFAVETTGLITGNSYQTVANARGVAREFASASKIDQIDLIHFALSLGTDSSKALANALLSAVKYNRTSSDMTNSYGVSIYFPYDSPKNVDQAASTYHAIGMDTEYGDCIREFAALEVSGQIATGGTANYTNSLLGLLGGGLNTGGIASSDHIESLLGSALGNQSGTLSGLGNVASLISGLTGGNLNFLTGRSLSNEEAAAYIAAHLIDPSGLNWKDGEEEGDFYIELSEEEWGLVNDIQLSVYYDDGEGYIDLGLDNVFEFDGSGRLLAPEGINALTVGGEVVAYYFDSMTSDGTSWQITGHVPVLLDGERANLILIFDNETPNGRVAGAAPVYEEGVGVLAKNMTELIDGQVIDFIADYYGYDGNYMDSYKIGDGAVTVSGALPVGSIRLEDGRVNAMYRLTDIYHQTYWTEALLY